MKIYYKLKAVGLFHKVEIVGPTNRYIPIRLENTEFQFYSYNSLSFGIWEHLYTAELS